MSFAKFVGQEISTTCLVNLQAQFNEKFPTFKILQTFQNLPNSSSEKSGIVVEVGVSRGIE
jgi:hypothetical protein